MHASKARLVGSIFQCSSANALMKLVWLTGTGTCTSVFVTNGTAEFRYASVDSYRVEGTICQPYSWNGQQV